MSDSSDYVACFDAAAPKFFGREAEFELQRDGEPLTLSLPKAEDDFADDDAAEAAAPEALAAARSILSQLDALDGQAKDYLIATPGWPYRDDVHLWLLLVQADNVRFCYVQWSVNDEQVVGFVRSGDGWSLIGPDPRFRG